VGRIEGLWPAIRCSPEDGVMIMVVPFFPCSRGGVRKNLEVRHGGRQRKAERSCHHVRTVPGESVGS
jgi:hypothetical protein